MTDVPPAIIQSMPDQYYAVMRLQRVEDRGDMVMALAHVLAESNFRDSAENQVTGAAGPYQFLESTWLELIMRHGRSLGVKPELTDHIRLDEAGRATIDDPQTRRVVLGLRHDIVLATRMTTLYADENRLSMTNQLGRSPGAAEVELSLLLGPTGASRLLEAARQNPRRPADDVLPEAATRNGPLFRTQQGGIRSASATVAYLVDKLVGYRKQILGDLANKPIDLLLAYRPKTDPPR